MVSFLLCGHCWQPKARSQLANRPCAWWSLSTTKHNITQVSYICVQLSWAESSVRQAHPSTGYIMLACYNMHSISSHHYRRARTLVSNAPSSKIPWWSCWRVLGRPRLWAWFGDGGGGGGTTFGSVLSLTSLLHQVTQLCDVFASNWKTRAWWPE